ncbi:MAG: hypothetical protein ACYTBX_17220 [Planctomycetota bacterium]
MIGIDETDFRLVVGRSQIDYNPNKEEENLRRHKRSLQDALPILEKVILPINSKPFLTKGPFERNGKVRHKRIGVDKNSQIVFFVTTMRPD